MPLVPAELLDQPHISSDNIFPNIIVLLSAEKIQLTLCHPEA